MNDKLTNVTNRKNLYIYLGSDQSITIKPIDGGFEIVHESWKNKEYDMLFRGWFQNVRFDFSSHDNHMSDIIVLEMFQSPEVLFWRGKRASFGKMMVTFRADPGSVFIHSIKKWIEKWGSR